MKKFGLYKKQKLCSTRAIEHLFSADGAEFSRLSFPLRAVSCRDDSRGSDAPLAILISVPKKRLRHAVDRVLMRRRIREAFRLNHHDCHLPGGLKIDLAFIYVANTLEPYAVVEKAVKSILTALEKNYTTE